MPYNNVQNGCKENLGMTERYKNWKASWYQQRNISCNIKIMLDKTGNGIEMDLGGHQSHLELGSITMF